MTTGLAGLAAPARSLTEALDFLLLEDRQPEAATRCRSVRSPRELAIDQE